MCTTKCKRLYNFMCDWRVFMVALTVTAIVGSSMDEYMGAILRMIERQFNLKSSETGVLTAAKYVGQLPFIMFISYIGGRYNPVRVLGGAYLLTGMMNLVIASTRFIVAKDIVHVTNTSNDDQSQQFCYEKHAHTPDTSFSMDEVAYAVFYVAYAVIGAATIPASTIMPAFIEDLIPKRIFPFALGASMAAENIGAFLGDAVASWANRLYVTLKGTDLTPSDPAWIGAWWAGFAIIGFLHIFSAFVMFVFPKRLVTNVNVLVRPQNDHPDDDSSDEDDDDGDDGQIETYKWKDLPKTLWGLLKNKLFLVLLIMNGIGEFGGDFGLKYYTTEFRIPDWKASLMAGVSGSVCRGISVVLGGLIVCKMRLTYSQTMLVCVIVAAILTGISVPAMLLHCDIGPVAGVNTSAVALTNECNDACNCTLEVFTPVCDAGLTYFSACHAGCSGYTTIKANDSSVTTYLNCACTESHKAIEGFCLTNCPIWIAFIVLLALPAIVGGLQDAPSTTNILRSVNRRDKAIGLGLMTLTGSLIITDKAIGLGLMTLTGSLISIGSPSAIGAIIDSACRVWGQDSAGSRENCWIYDYADYRLRYMGTNFGINCSLLLTYAAAYVLTLRDPDKTRPLPRTRINDNADDTEPLNPRT